MRDKDLNWTIGITPISKKSLRLALTLSSALRAAVVCREENYIRGERISIVFSRLRGVDVCRAQGGPVVFLKSVT